MQTPNWRERVRKEFLSQVQSEVPQSMWTDGFMGDMWTIADWWITRMEQVQKESIERAIEVVGNVRRHTFQPADGLSNIEHLEYQDVITALKTLLH